MIGIDITKISRFEKWAENENLMKRVFTKSEREYLKRRGNRQESIAGLWAAKEAASKVLGFGFGSKYAWTDYEIAFYHGQPRIKKPVSMKLSISHDGEYAIAWAMKKWNRKKISPFKIPQRLSNTHKGDYGKLCLIGGKKGMSGSICLSTMASLRAGVGLAYTMVPECISEIVQNRLLEAVIYPLDSQQDYFDGNSWKTFQELRQDFDAYVIGPGIGKEEETKNFLIQILKSTTKPKVIDADAISLLEGGELNKNCIVTPHEGEFSRWQHLNREEISKHRVELAKKVALIENCIVVLKGHQTVVTDGKEVYINCTGNPGMATAGSGDVLAGMIGAFLVRGFKNIEAAKLGVYLHGLSGDMAKKVKGEESLIARDLVRFLPQAIRRVK